MPAGSVSKDRGAGVSGPQLTNVGLVAAPDGLGWHGRLENLRDPDVLAVIWYKYEKRWDLWRSLPELSGKVDPAKLVIDAEGNASEFRSYLDATNQRACAENGEYRAEFYLNGKLLDLDPGESLNYPSMTAGGFRDLNISMCHPPDWDRWRPVDALDDFMNGGYVSRDALRGIFAFNYYFPRGSLDEAAKEKLAERSLADLALTKFIPLNQYSIEANSCPITSLDQTVIAAKSEITSGIGLARVWASQDGMVHVGVARSLAGGLAKPSGSDAAVGSKAAECSALQSMQEIYGPY